MTTTAARANGARILYCHCAGSENLPREVKDEVLAGLVRSGVAFEAVSDLCRLAARRDPALRRLVAGDGRIDVVACFPRAVKWLFEAAGVPVPENGFRVHNLRTESAAATLAGILDGASPDATTGTDHQEESARLEAEAARPGAWTPWFPVIDYERCENCHQCLGFCLFGVFDLDADDQVRVRNPDKCKTNCPACARVCPQAAIIFPKYPHGPINGDEVRPADLEREKVGTDVAALLGGGDLQALLRERQQRAAARFSAERDEARALSERQCCLKKLQEALDVPDEVLADLSSGGVPIETRWTRRVAAARENPEPDRP